jgi:hypothetical protein
VGLSSLVTLAVASCGDDTSNTGGSGGVVWTGGAGGGGAPQGGGGGGGDGGAPIIGECLAFEGGRTTSSTRSTRWPSRRCARTRPRRGPRKPSPPSGTSRSTAATPSLARSAAASRRAVSGTTCGRATPPTPPTSRWPRWTRCGAQLPGLQALRARRGGSNPQIVQDTGTGGSYPVSTDRVVWALGASELLKHLDGAEPRELPRSRLPRDGQHRRARPPRGLRRRDGLYRGEQSFLDWREQTYPGWTATDPAHIAMSQARSAPTCCTSPSSTPSPRSPPSGATPAPGRATAPGPTR